MLGESRMEISIKKQALKEFINKALKENRTGSSSNMTEIPAKDEDDNAPIEASPQVAVQLSTDRRLLKTLSLFLRL